MRPTRPSWQRQWLVFLQWQARSLCVWGNWRRVAGTDLRFPCVKLWQTQKDIVTICEGADGLSCMGRATF